MSFINTFVQQIESAWTGATLHFGQADGATNPYIVILIVPPNDETPDVLCLDQGNGGELTLQFSCAADSIQEAISELGDLLPVVRAIRGTIGTAPDEYRISQCRCSGVQSFDASLGTWAAVFDTTVRWEKT